MSLRQPRILFVEDHEDTRDLISLVLQQSHYEVATAATLDDSLKLARSGSFNLFIFDSWLPDGSGIDLCKQVREFDHCTPILFYSGAAYETDRKLALSSGAQAYLVKPIETSELLQAIKSLMIKEREPLKGLSEVKESKTGLHHRLAAAKLL
jgi:two-component system OmpR family response regulator